MNRQELIRSFAAGPRLLRETLNNLPPDMWQWKPAPDRWSVHEIIIHMPDSEASGYVRLRKIIAEPGSTLGAYDQEAFTDKLPYHQLDIDTALELFSRMRELSVQLLEHVEESVWLHKAIHEEHGEVDLDWWLRCYEEHVGLHITQMKRNMAEWEAAGRPKV
ncbi:hypothetical protein GF377_07735 [candidate division GN15 bacterium]|nr:hypothetical protein [candidate division GN15 bacterium]